MSSQEFRPLDETPGEVITRYALDAIVLFVVVGIGYAILKSWIDVPLNFMQPWTTIGGLWDGMEKVWFIFAWAAGLTLLFGLIQVVRRTPRDYEPSEYFGRGSWVSINAGVFEEIIYRWLLLFGMMIFLKVMNAITFGLVKWFFTTVLIPIANWASFGLLEPQFYGDFGWLFAAAIVSANVRFRRGHEYQGLFGVINAWYIGLIFFYLMFNYGLWVAIVAHVAYDLIIFWLRGVFARFQPESTFANIMRSAFRSRF